MYQLSRNCTGAFDVSGLITILRNSTNAQLRATAYQAFAYVPGTKMLGDQKDQLGRVGAAIQFTLADRVRTGGTYVIGSSGGAILGGALGWMVGIGALAIPGLGPFIAAGPIMAALAGAAGGAAAGGLTGALIGMGIPEYEAKRYEGKVKDGNILMSVHTEDSKERDRAKAIFVNGGAEDISYTGEASVDKDHKPADPNIAAR